MKLFIYEYFASGAKESHAGLKRAGLEMLKAVLEDFNRNSELQIFTILDSSLKNNGSLNLSRHNVEITWKNDLEEKTQLFEQTLANCDLALVIAPETAGILTELTTITECRGKKVLGSGSQTLKITCNKAETLRLMKNKGLSVPKSTVLKKAFAADVVSVKDKILKEFSFPLVIKPNSGTGGEGVRLIKNEYQLYRTLSQIDFLKESSFLVQEYIRGETVSVSLFVLNGKAVPLSLNKQIINNEGELFFRGIIVPYAHPQGRDIIETAVKACQHVPGLKGFVGVDFVLSPQGPILMEINSRLTLAYVALRKVVSRNLAKDMLILCTDHIFPEKVEFQGTCIYYP